ncbi:Tol-Pal system beta propeller repeat protein TolB [Geobacter grbiciae]|uniref:Tol-Pal system beta propeller repeat protein TolB n=1 Tax=Geobacter grbiciae TaxID=155042 RepID=UPI001C0389DF|nr:Tol-Pal system beta propeller repeat protein TolB [Geobacter grbiciae]MBT1073888.1 Tol-Pal system beta propeller repeat protein TolB [Geobacter grbiciae]
MTRRLFILITIMLCLIPALLHSQEGYREVTAAGTHKLTLTVDSPRRLGGSDAPQVARETAEALQFDMVLAGPFTVTAPSTAAASAGIRPGEFDFAPWRGAGVDLLVKSGYTVTGNAMTMEFRLYNVTQGKEILAKRYTGRPGDVRRIAHTFSDDIMAALTGERGPFTGKIAFVSTRAGAKAIFLMDYDGHNVQQLTKNRSINLNPDFSPSGKEIIFTSYRQGNPDLFRRELFTGAEARISSYRGINATGAWSPDGKTIALTLSKDGNSEIYTISRDGKSPHRLTNTSAIEVSPAWSPDGRKIVFVSDRLGKPQIFIMNADGTGVRRLTTNGSYNVSPRWSPKGDRIVYCRQEGGFQIYAINPDGSGDTRLTSEGSNEHPRWSPDGRFITFSSTRGGGERIHVMRADGSGQTRVSGGKGRDSHPAWSPRW